MKNNKHGTKKKKNINVNIHLKSTATTFSEITLFPHKQSSSGQGDSVPQMLPTEKQLSFPFQSGLISLAPCMQLL